MRRASLLLLLTMLKVWGSCEDLNFFSSNNDVPFDEVEPNLLEGFFADVAYLGFNDNPLVNDDLLNSEEFLPTEPISDNFLTADDSTDCSSLSSFSRRIRVRSGSCSAKSERYLDVRTAEDVKKYWCSETNHLGFANIPVCNLLPNAGVKPSEHAPWPEIDISSIPPGFTSLAYCRISKFFHFCAMFEFTPSLKIRRA